MSQKAGRVTGFSRLINEKTMIQEVKPADQAMERLCPQLPSDDEIEDLGKAQPLLEKFVKELVVKMRSNTFHMLFDEPIFLTDEKSVVWWPDSQREDNIFENDIDVLLGIRRAPGTKIDQSIGDGYAHVNISQAPRFEDSQTQDIFEHVRSKTGKRMNPRAVCRVQHRIMQLTLRNIVNRYKGLVRVDELSSPDRQNSFRLCVSLSQQYIERQPQQEEDEEQRSKSVLSVRADDERRNAAINSARKKSSRMSSVPEEELEEEEEERRSFSIRFFTGMNYLSKERIYFIARPYPYDLFNYKDDVWRYFYRLRESQLLLPVFRADQFRRLRAMAGLVRLCAVDPDLYWVSDDHLRQLVLHLVQNEIDSGSRWQRLSLLQCAREILNGLRNCLSQKTLKHYFMDSLNLVEFIDNDLKSRSIVRCSVLIKSDSALLRAVGDALQTAAKSVKNTQETQSEGNGTITEE